MMLALVSLFPLLGITLYLGVVSVMYCSHERKLTGKFKIYDKLVLITATAVFLQIIMLLGGVIAVSDLNNWQFNLAMVTVECVCGSVSRCIVQLSLWMKMRCVFRGREGSQKNISYVIGNMTAVVSIVSSVLSLAGHSAGEALKRKVLGWTLPCKTYTIMKLIVALTNVTDLTTKMTLISLVLHEVLRQKRANSQHGFGFADLQDVARRMVVCMAFALVNDLVLISVGLLPLVDDMELRAELLPTVSCFNSLCNLVILIISFPTCRNRLIPRKFIKDPPKRGAGNLPLAQAPTVTTVTERTADNGHA